MRRGQLPPPRERWTHGGSGAAYDYGCRCEPCSTAHRARIARARERRAAAPVPPTVTHGASCYNNWGCRCQVCVEAHAERMRKAREARKARQR